MLRINNIKLRLNENDYAGAISSKINVPKRQIHDVILLKRSIDARHKHVNYIASFAFSCDHEDRVKKRQSKVLSVYTPYVYEYPKKE